MQFKRVGALVLVVGLAISSLAGCSNITAATNASQSSSSAQVTTAGDTSATETNSVTEPIEMDLFVNFNWWPLKEWAGSVPEEITQKTGIKFNVTIASDEKQLPLMIASGDLPEMIFTDNTGNMQKRLSDSNLSLPWNDLIDQYAPDFQIPQEISAMYTQKDGNFYTVLNNYSTKAEWDAADTALPNGAGIAVRADLMQKLGNPQVKSLDDFEKLLAAVKKQFPELIPLVLNSNWDGVGVHGSWLGNQFGLNYGLNLNDDKVSYYLKNPARLDYYKYVNKLYREGYIIPENYSFKNEDESFNYAYNGKCFAYMKTTDVADSLNAKLKELGKDFTFQQITTSLTDDVKYFTNGIGWAGVFITKNNKHPKEAINAMKFLRSEEGQHLGMWGIEGEHWTMNAQGSPDFKFSSGDETFKNAEGIRWWGLLIGSAVTEGMFNYNPQAVNTIPAAGEVKKNMVYQPAVGMLVPETDSEENNIKGKLDDMIKNQEVKIYLAKSEADCVNAFEELNQLAEKIGVAKYESWANTKYQEVKSLFQ